MEKKCAFHDIFIIKVWSHTKFAITFTSGSAIFSDLALKPNMDWTNVYLKYNQRS